MPNVGYPQPITSARMTEMRWFPDSLLSDGVVKKRRTYRSHGYLPRRAQPCRSFAAAEYSAAIYGFWSEFFVEEFPPFAGIQVI